MDTQSAQIQLNTAKASGQCFTVQVTHYRKTQGKMSQGLLDGKEAEYSTAELIT